MKVALIHDHLAQDGGAERVLKVLADLFPQAPIFTLLYEKKYADKYYRHRQIETSIIQKLPGGVSHYQWYMPFMPMAVEFFDLSGYDLVISDSSSFAKGVITSSHTLHLCYCHTPTRYLWSDTHQYINELKYSKYFKKAISLALNYIRMWDKLAADRADAYIANSRFVAGRIRKYYKRESTVIYPPVEVEQFKIAPATEDYFLIGGRLAPYKRVDLVIEAFKRAGKKLKIFGDGVDLPRLKNLARGCDNIEFLGRVNDETKAKLYGQALAFIYPQEEDFGITAVEAMASGRPVIAYASGGALETVQDGVSGIFFNEQTAASLAQAINNFNSSKFDPKIIKQHAEQFGVERFKKEISELIGREWGKFKTGN
ncbi:MAG: glycosyltransferase [Patescibacteria group bacterium]|nr:glycosyltransferase [Patescibacteria group bacterium]